MAPPQEEWVRSIQPGWTLRFAYPSTDGAGRRVIVELKQTAQSVRGVHVMAEDRDEIYFEVVRRADVAASALYAEMQRRLPALYPDIVFEQLVLDDESIVGGFAWGDQKRMVRFFELTDATYRVLFRPAASNLAILDTVETGH